MDELPAIKFLKDKEIPFAVKTFPDTIKKGTTAISSVLGVRSNIVVKTLVFRGKSGTFYICLVGGEGKLHYKKLRKLTEEKDMQMATPGEIFDITGYEVGAIPPFALKNDLRTFIDITLEDEDVLFVGAGQFGIEIILSPEDLKRATNGEFADIIRSTEQSTH